MIKITVPPPYASLCSVGCCLCENSVNVSSNLLCWQYVQLYQENPGREDWGQIMEGLQSQRENLTFFKTCHPSPPLDCKLSEDKNNVPSA